MAAANCPAVGRYVGSMMGALAGDCLGGRFEDNPYWSPAQHPGLDYLVQMRSFRDQVTKFTNFVCNHATGAGVPADAVTQQRCNQLVEDGRLRLKYTDDSTMQLDLLTHLVEHNANVDDQKLAKRFCETYFAEVHRRAYGRTVGDVFAKLRKSKYKADCAALARQQFEGAGSYANGAAMRTACVALAAPNDWRLAAELAMRQALLTHSAADGVVGAVLQTLAVRHALHLDHDSLSDLKSQQAFVDTMIAHLTVLFDNNSTMRDVVYQKSPIKFVDSVYYEKLQRISAELGGEQSEEPWHLACALGNGIAASEAVPAALYAFLRCTRPLTCIQVDNPVLRTIAFAMGLGGDVDTTATMAGAIAGAYYAQPEQTLPPSVCQCFEESDRFAQLATKLHAISSSQK